MDLQTTIFLGRSGSGKGTQIERLIEHIGKKDNRSIVHLEAGQRFRDFISEDGSYASKLAKEINDQGGLQPAFLSVWAWGGKIARTLDKDEHLLIDGTPRRIIEANMLDEALDFFSRSPRDFVYINVSSEWAIARMKDRGRDDDKNLRDIATRLEWFDGKVMPVIDRYRINMNYRFHEINGEQSIDKVHEDIVKALGI